MTATIIYNDKFEPIAVIDLEPDHLSFLAKTGSLNLAPPMSPLTAVPNMDEVPRPQDFDYVELRKVDILGVPGAFLATTNADPALVRRLTCALLPGQAEHYKRRNPWGY